jgi:drug/metabolite transporter (DMT)-like permease
MSVYSEDRVRRLRIVLWVVVALGVLIAPLAALTLASDEHRGAGVAGVVVAALVLGSSGTALRLLSDPERPAKVAAIATGVLCVVAAVLSGGVFAFLLLPVGLGVLFLALLPDESEAGK